VLIVAILLLLCAAAQSFSSEKKGVAIADQAGTKVSALNVAWFYNWRLTSSASALSNCFVPMLWGSKKQLEELAPPDGAVAKPRFPVLLAYNEPERTKQANRSVTEVLSEWRLISSLAARVSSPAPVRPFDPWMRSFMAEAERQALDVDFIALHWYGAADGSAFLSLIDRVHETYKRPIWITEFAVADWKSAKFGAPNRFTEDDVIRFVKEVIPGLERREFVERYAWLGATTGKESLRPSLLFDKQGGLTAVGATYAQLEPASSCKLH
jgi:hypothetical protein